MQQMRAHAIAHTLFGPTTLPTAIDQLGFVQADPIRAPAPAQDLILRHRVEGYKVGDLNRQYSSLGIEEGALYAHGYLPRSTWQLRQHECDPATLSPFEQKVMAAIQGRGAVRAKDLEAEFGKERVRSDWGGSAQATTQALQSLFRHGFVRIAGRQSSRLYEVVSRPAPDRPSANERFRRLVLVEAHILAPVRIGTLQFLTSGLRAISFPEADNHRKVIQDLMRSGELAQRTVDETVYLWPASTTGHEEVPRVARILTPFDPLVWDRGRFEHFWGWEYRFEAYTPKEKRVRGYYALPLLWGEEMIGWANAGITDGKLQVEIGYIDKQPKERLFRQELDAEISRLESFLGLDKISESTPPKTPRRRSHAHRIATATQKGTVIKPTT